VSQETSRCCHEPAGCFCMSSCAPRMLGGYTAVVLAHRPHRRSQHSKARNTAPFDTVDFPPSGAPAPALPLLLMPHRQVPPTNSSPPEALPVLKHALFARCCGWRQRARHCRCIVVLLRCLQVQGRLKVVLQPAAACTFSLSTQQDGLRAQYANTAQNRVAANGVDPEPP
jgi:hypothetical protein